MKRKALAGGMVLAGVLLGSTHSISQPLRVRIDRWLELQQMAGSVQFEQGSRSQRARKGDRLQAVGDGISTGKGASATLGVDTGIGVINVAESTRLRVQELAMAPDNGRITRLQVTQGQASLRIRPFTHKGSELEIRTPASVSGVRGTEFGVAVQPNGKTGLAVLQGGVTSSAQGQLVAVNGGFQNFTIPGEPPTPPVPLRNDTRLIRSEFDMVIEGGVRRVRLLGQVDPVNSVLVDGIPQVTDRTGQFTTTLRPLPSFLTVKVTVITPLGKQEVYELAFQ